MKKKITSWRLWKVFLNEEFISIACYDKSLSADEVKKSLINNDGYSCLIRVRPMSL